jgi:HEAT repeat protein
MSAGFQPALGAAGTCPLIIMTEANILQRHIKMASSSDPDERAESARELKPFLQNPTASAILLEMLSDSDWRVRRAAVESILDAHLPNIIPQILLALYDEENAGRRNAAIDILSRFGPDIFPYLESHLQTTNADVRMFLVNILGEMRNDSHLDFILQSLEHKNKNLVSAAIVALGRIGRPETAEKLRNFLLGADTWFTFQAIEAAGEMQEPSLIPDLVRLSDLSYYHNAAVKALSRFHDISAYRALVSSLFHGNEIDIAVLYAVIDLYDSPAPSPLKESERKEIRNELRMLGSDQLELLTEAIQKYDGLHKKNLIRIAGLAGANSAVKGFVQSLRDPDLEEVASQSLVLCDRDSAAPLMEELKQELEDEEVIRDLEILNELSATPNVDQLTPHLNHINPEIRHLTHRLLSRSKSQEISPWWILGTMDPYPPIQQHCQSLLLDICRRNAAAGDEIRWAMREKMQSESSVERANALEFLIRLDGESAFSLLFQALKDEDAIVRKKAISMMSTGYHHEFQKFLIAAIADEDSGVREVAAKSLASYAGPEVLEALVASASDDDLWVRVAAFESLARLEAENAVEIFERQFEKENPIGKTALLKGLGHFRTPKSREILLKALNSEDSEIRKAVCESLGIFNESDIVFRLFTLMQNDSDWSVRAAAIRALSTIRPFRLQEALIERLQLDPDPFVRKEILNSLQKLEIQYLPTGVCGLVVDKNLADAAYDFLMTFRNRFSKQIQESARSHPPAVRRILKTITG